MFEETDGLIHKISQDSDRYATLTEGLILQGAYALMEEEITIKCREEDVDQVNSAIENVSGKYGDDMKFKPTFIVSEEYLPASR